MGDKGADGKFGVLGEKVSVCFSGCLDDISHLKCEKGEFYWGNK